MPSKEDTALIPTVLEESKIRESESGISSGFGDSRSDKMAT